MGGVSYLIVEFVVAAKNVMLGAGIAVRTVIGLPFEGSNCLMQEPIKGSQIYEFKSSVSTDI